MFVEMWIVDASIENAMLAADVAGSPSGGAGPVLWGGGFL